MMNTTLDMFNLFGLNGMHSDGDDFNQWATTELKKLFPFLPNIKSDSEIVYSNIDELNKFKDSKILILCGGPSTSEVDWSNLDYDYVWSLNSFFLNDKFKNTKIDLMCVGGEIDFQSDDFLNYANNYNPLMLFEIHDRWYDESIYLNALYQSYPKLGCFHTRAYGKLGGGVRLMILALYLKAKEIYIVGSDGCPGLSVTKKQFIESKHSFENNKHKWPWLITEDNAYDVYYRQHEDLWNYILNDLNFDTKIFNLGENCEFNFSSIWSKKYFPLPEDIKNKINIS